MVILTEAYAFFFLFVSCSPLVKGRPPSLFLLWYPFPLSFCFPISQLTEITLPSITRSFIPGGGGCFYPSVPSVFSLSASVHRIWLSLRQYFSLTTLVLLSTLFQGFKVSYTHSQEYFNTEESPLAAFSVTSLRGEIVLNHDRKKSTQKCVIKGLLCLNTLYATCVS